MMGWTEEDRRRTGALGDHRRALGMPEEPAVTGDHRLPRSGRSQDRIYLQRNQDYPADTDLCFERGNAVTLVRMTGRDMHAIRAVLTEQGDLDAMKARARDLIVFGAVADAERDGPEELAAAVENLAVTAHAAGYRLAVDDMRHAASEKGYVSDFLGALPSGRPPVTAAGAREYLEGLVKVWDPDPTRPLDGMATRTLEALRHVIGMLGG